MHSDSSSFSLSSIETEVRRRVWWTICYHDVRISSHIGLQNHVPIAMNTDNPLHVNDSDLGPTNTALLEREEYSEMSLSLAKIEKARTLLILQAPATTQKERTQIVFDQVQRYETIYLKYFAGESKIQCLAYLGVRLIIARLHATLNTGYGSDEECRDSLITATSEILDVAHQLPHKYRQHGWFFRCRYTQWHAVAYLLVQMCTHTTGPVVDRAWEVIDASFADWEEGGISQPQKDTGNPCKALEVLWQPLLRLLQRARDKRQQALNSCGASVSTDALSYHTPKDYGEPPQIQDEESASDPFFGATDDLHFEMNWEKLDDWALNFRGGLVEQAEEREGDNVIGTMDWF